MRNPIFTGSAPALITPFRDGKPDYDALEALLRRQVRGGSHAIILAGTTGESATLEYAEHARLLRFAADVLDGCIPLIAGAGSNSTFHAQRLVEQAEEAGANGLLLVTPYYNKASQTGLIQHYTTLADRTALPILLYNVPSRTGVSLSPETLQILSSHPRIVGIKEAGTDFDSIARAMRLCPADFSFYSGNDSLTLPLMALGARGVISVAANVLPEAMSCLCQACLNGNWEQARALHFCYLPLMQGLFTEVNPIPVKAAMAAMGLCGEELRLPLTPLTGEKREQLLSLLREYHLLPEAVSE